MELASAGSVSLPGSALVLDYIILNSSMTNYTFRGDTTYYISGPVNLYGTNVLEGGTVLKYANSGSVAINGALKCATGPYRPAVLTAKDDESVGETINGSTGNPVRSSYLALNLLSSLSPTLSHIRVAYAGTAAVIYGAGGAISNAQFVNCGYGLVFLGSGYPTIENALFSDVQYAIILYGSGCYPRAVNVTFDRSSYLVGGGAYFVATNCIFANVTNLGTSGFGSHNGFYNSPQFGENRFISPVYPFQTVGGGSYYLVDGAGFRNVGTTNISTNLLAELRKKTTYPPIAFTNVTFTEAMVFSPQAQRDTDTPDLGYHYDPLDYAFGGCHAYSNITFTPGTIVGWFRTSSGWYHAGFGIRMNAGVTVSFEGTATSPVWWVRLNTVQEQDRTGGYGQAGICSWTDVNIPTVRARFLRCSAMASEKFNGYFADDWGSLRAEVLHSEFWGGNLHAYANYIYYTNCLMWRPATVGIENGNYSSAFIMRNCTVYGGQLLMQRWVGPTLFSVRDCAFDGTEFKVSGDPYGSDPNVTDFDFNAYTNASNPFQIGGAHNVRVVNFNWQSGPLGNFYLPPNSPLIDAGSRTADQVGLYHFTTRTSQLKETNSVVDIGYHYVAVDANGNSIDTDGDGLPDYWEDTNGNGSGADDFTSWLVYNSANGLSPANGLVVFTPLK